MEQNIRTRFKDAPWLQPKKIVLGGAGGIGSWVALALSRIGHELFVYDMDKVDYTNLGGQFFNTSGISVAKTEALNKNIQAFTDKQINQFGKFTEDSFVAPITIAAFDNMKARKLMFQKWKEQEDRELFLDGRCTAEFFEVFAVRKGEEEAYEATLFEDHEADVLLCSFKATTHNSMGIAFILTGTLNNFLADIPIRPVNFHTKFNIALFYMEQNDSSVWKMQENK